MVASFKPSGKSRCYALIQVNSPACAIDYNNLTIFNAVQGASNIDNGGNTIFPGDDGPMRELPSDFEYDAAHQGENGRPAGIGRLGDQDIAG